ncbi:MAG TPA: hypothetical protein VNH44_16410 [Micropepsaceae bacterium]|nr:hypothetical protein [Micropepsaceae bacterium]
MRQGLGIAALSVLGAALWAPLAFGAAAPVRPAFILAPVSTVSLDRSGHVVNLNLGGLMNSGLAQDVPALRPNGITVASGVQLELSRGRNWDPYADLFPSIGSLNSTYLSGTNTRASASFALSKDISLDASHVALGLGVLSDAQPSGFARDLAQRLGADVPGTGTTSAKLNWNFSDWGGVALMASQSNGDGALLSSIPASLRGGVATDSSALGISARVGFGEGWVTSLTYAEGVTQLDLSRDKLVASGDPVRSEAYGIGLAKTGLFGDDAFGIALSRPLQIYTGSVGFGALNTNFALANTQARESDVELGYVTTFLDGTLALQANAAYQLNAAGTRGQNAVTGVARAKLNF